MHLSKVEHVADLVQMATMELSPDEYRTGLEDWHETLDWHFSRNRDDLIHLCDIMPQSFPDYRTLQLYTTPLTSDVYTIRRNWLHREPYLRGLTQFCATDLKWTAEYLKNHFFIYVFPRVIKQAIISVRPCSITLFFLTHMIPSPW